MEPSTTEAQESTCGGAPPDTAGHVEPRERNGVAAGLEVIRAFDQNGVVALRAGLEYCRGDRLGRLHRAPHGIVHFHDRHQGAAGVRVAVRMEIVAPLDRVAL